MLESEKQGIFCDRENALFEDKESIAKAQFKELDFAARKSKEFSDLELKLERVAAKKAIVEINAEKTSKNSKEACALLKKPLPF